MEGGKEEITKQWIIKWKIKHEQREKILRGREMCEREQKSEAEYPVKERETRKTKKTKMNK